MAHPLSGSTVVSTNPTTIHSMMFDRRVTKIEETTTRIIHFTPDPEILGPRRALASNPILRQLPCGKIQILYHEFDGLKQTTRDQIIFVYGQTMGQKPAYDSYFENRQALRLLGVGQFEYEKDSRISPDKLLTNWIYEWNKLFIHGYEMNPDTTDSLKEQAYRRIWGLGELKAITARWMQGKDEDKLLEPGRKLMKKHDENRPKGYDTFQQATKSFREGVVSKGPGASLEGKLLTEMEANRFRDARTEIRRREMENEGNKMEEVVQEDWMREARCNTRRTIQLDAKALKLNDIKKVHESLRKLIAELENAPDTPEFTDIPRIPLDRRLEAPQCAAALPWVKTEKRERRS